MNEFYLFLDESKPNTNFNNFTLGGIIVEKQVYEKLVKPAVKEIKKECFDDSEIILHEIDIRGKKREFSEITRETQEKFFEKLKELFKKDYFSVMAVSVNMEKLDELYHADSRNTEYYIALQILLENFNHFLINNDGLGRIYLESTDPGNDQRLQNLYYRLLSTGTLYYKKECLQKRLVTMDFGIKSENIIGLQIADFIPNALARETLGKRQKPFSILDEIKAALYDGKINRADKFGFKKIS